MGGTFSFGALDEPGPGETSFPDFRETLPSAEDRPGISFRPTKYTRGDRGKQCILWHWEGGERRRMLCGSFYHVVHWGQRRKTCHLVLPMPGAHWMTSAKLHSLSMFQWSSCPKLKDGSVKIYFSSFMPIRSLFPLNLVNDLLELSL